MAFDENIANRVRSLFLEKEVDFTEKRMFSGICFMVDDKMCCGTHFDKKLEENVLLCRVGDEAYENALEQNHCIPMEFTGKPMKGYVYVTEEGMRKNENFARWIQLCLDFNPKAKRSKKKS